MTDETAALVVDNGSGMKLIKFSEKSFNFSNIRYKISRNKIY